MMIQEYVVESSKNEKGIGGREPMMKTNEPNVLGLREGETVALRGSNARLRTHKPMALFHGPCLLSFRATNTCIKTSTHPIVEIDLKINGFYNHLYQDKYTFYYHLP